MARASSQRPDCEAKVQGRWRPAKYHGEPFRVTKAQARRSAKLRGMRPRELPAGEWVSVCVIPTGQGALSGFYIVPVAWTRPARRR